MTMATLEVGNSRTPNYIYEGQVRIWKKIGPEVQKCLFKVWTNGWWVAVMNRGK
jgi:hypothetical protein